ncbi:M23 family metallopeptidase [Erythrobacter crassostreae]|uniref:M23 family metallopeptidase n=1 Tax=Erythrobacter crassostreae TaxID=2828328 RepID=A0A9X1F4G3_9SPHN|nr:M23 family metallopeptidase [Erythrobacter crassostrea]MBV7258635.1 M23 family metallopeptidase [Erythrobacter crassostrea]
MALSWITLALACAVTGCAPGEAEVTAEKAPVAAPEAPTSTQSYSIAPPPPATPPDFDFTGELTQGGWIRGTIPVGARSAKLGNQTLTVDESGRTFFAAFDRDSPSSITLSATLANGATFSEQITVSPRKWNIQRVNVAKRGGGSSEAWWKKREPEWLAIKGAREKVTGAAGWQQDFVWPVKGRISGQFGRQRIYRGEPGSYHSGIDIAPGNGVPFVAPADGVVVLARTGFSLEGNIIIIDHGAGLNSAFLHASKLAVKEGQAVKQGEYIGNVGSTGRSTGPHLHWSLKWNDARLDPLLFTGPMN